MILLDKHPIVAGQLICHRHSIADAGFGYFSGPRKGLPVALEVATQVILACELVVIAEVRHSLVRTQLLPIPVQRLSQYIARFAPPQMPAGIFRIDYLEE